MKPLDMYLFETIYRNSLKILSDYVTSLLKEYDLDDQKQKLAFEKKIKKKIIGHVEDEREAEMLFNYISKLIY